MQGRRNQKGTLMPDKTILTGEQAAARFNNAAHDLAVRVDVVFQYPTVPAVDHAAIGEALEEFRAARAALYEAAAL